MNEENTNYDFESAIQHVNNPVLDLPQIVKKYLGQVTSYVQRENCFYFTDGSATVEIKVVSNEIIRVRLAPNSQFLADFSYALADNEHLLEVYGIEEEEEVYRVWTNTVCCVVRRKDFVISFEDRDHVTINSDQSPMHWEENPEFGGYYVYCTKDTTNTEAFYGMGDKPTNLNLRGKRLVNWNSDTYSFAFNQDPLYRTIPFYIGLDRGRAYGIFFDNTFKSYFDFAHQVHNQTSFWSEGGELQYYYIHGPSMLEVVRRYHELTGTHYLPPLWALGFHQCRWSYYPENKVKGIAENFRKRAIPCDAIYLDIDYMDGYRCFTWNKHHFPDPKRMVKELADQGFKTVVIIDPGIKVDDNYWVFKEGKENEFFCRRGDDYFMEGHVWPGRCQFPDFTNPKVRQWWGSLFKGLVEAGVAGVWNDMNEPAVFGRGTFPDDVRHYFEGYRGSHRKAHNVYGMQMVRATYDGLRKLFQDKRPFTITRAAYAGTQRYSSVWTGDNVATWEHLRLGVLQLQRLSISGMSFCGTDIGGFTGEPDGELYTRWIQFGVFSPLMRAHSAGDTREREPWSFGEYYEAINKKFIELRYQLLPYIYSVFWEQTRYGYPILRPLTFLEQNIAHNSYREEEFCFGSKLLVSPVINQGEQAKRVYLPAGNWYDYWSKEFFEGGKEYDIPTPLESMPIFVKEGAVIPVYPVMQYVDLRKVRALSLHIYFAELEVNSFIYEDHGETSAYEQDIYLEKKFIVKGNKRTFSVNQSTVGLFTERYQTYEIQFIGLPYKAFSILVDDQAVDGRTNDEGVVRLTVSKDFENITINDHQL